MSTDCGLGWKIAGSDQNRKTKNVGGIASPGTNARDSPLKIEESQFFAARELVSVYEQFRTIM